MKRRLCALVVRSLCVEVVCDASLSLLPSLSLLLSCALVPALVPLRVPACIPVADLVPVLCPNTSPRPDSNGYSFVNYSVYFGCRDRLVVMSWIASDGL